VKNSNDSRLEAFEDGDFRRQSVPNTQALQTSIIDTAKKLPQQPSSMQASRSMPALRELFSWYKPVLHSTAIAAVMVVAIIGLFAVDFSDHQPSPEIFSEHDLDWQELMLIEDDLLFSQLAANE